MTENKYTLDARGLQCPTPIIRAKKILSKMETGKILEITATDPGSLRDFPSFCQQTGHQLLSSESVNDNYVFRISRS